MFTVIEETNMRITIPYCFALSAFNFLWRYHNDFIMGKHANRKDVFWQDIAPCNLFSAMAYLLADTIVANRNLFKDKLMCRCPLFNVD